MVSKFKLDTTKSISARNAINRTLEIANNYAGELSVEVLSLDKVELDPDNHRELVLTLSDAMNGIEKSDPEYDRKKQDWKSLESLAKTIKDDQLINPIYVYRFGNKCRLIAGERRTLASAISGKREIIARIASQRPMGTKLRVLQWIENNERSDLSLSERLSSLESIIKEYHVEHSGSDVKITAKALGDLTGMSITQARRYILVLQSKPQIKNAIREGKLENIKMIELICSAKTNERQDELLQAAISGASFEAIAKLKREIESGNRVAKKETRGRKKKNVSLGRVKPGVARLIMDALISSNILEAETINKIHSIYDRPQWDDTESAEKGFKEIMLLLEESA